MWPKDRDPQRHEVCDARPFAGPEDERYMRPWVRAAAGGAAVVLGVQRGEAESEEPVPPRRVTGPDPAADVVDLDGKLFDPSPYQVDPSPKSSPNGEVLRRGGKRGEIVRFSRASRRRLMLLFSAVPWRSFDPRRLVFVTLTYPNKYPANPRKWKEDLWAFRRRLERSWGPLSIIWKMEFQKRGAAHFHLLLFCEDSLVPPRSEVEKPWPLAASMLEAWHEIAGAGDKRHLRHGVDVRQANSWRGAMMYLSKYLAKVQTVEHEESIGRLWGVWRYEALQVRWLSWNLSWVQYLRLRRLLRRKCKYRRGRAGFQQMICFLEFSEFLRALEFVGALANPPPSLPWDRAEVLGDLVGVLRATCERVESCA